MLCYVMLCYGYAMLCYAMLYCMYVMFTDVFVTGVQFSNTGLVYLVIVQLMKEDVARTFANNS